MRISEAMRYPGSPGQVFAMLTDTDYQLLRCHQSGASDPTAEAQSEPGGITVLTVQCYLPTSDLPDLVRTFVGPRLLVKEVRRWHPADSPDGRTCSMTLEFSGTPVTFTGVATLSQDGHPGASVQQIDGELNAAVPLLGRRIEQAVAGQLTALVRAEERSGQDWLADH